MRRFTVPERMKKIPETKARMVRWGRMWPTLLMMKAVKTKSRETIGKGVAVRTISARSEKTRVKVVHGNWLKSEIYWHSLRIFAVFSVVISISGSVKYSEATHRPFSEPTTVSERVYEISIIKQNCFYTFIIENTQILHIERNRLNYYRL